MTTQPKLLGFNAMQVLESFDKGQQQKQRRNALEALANAGRNLEQGADLKDVAPALLKAGDMRGYNALMQLAFGNQNQQRADQRLVLDQERTAFDQNFKTNEADRRQGRFEKTHNLNIDRFNEQKQNNAFTRQHRVRTASDTKDIREYRLVRQQGFQGTFQDYLAAKQQRSNQSQVKPPSGYRWQVDKTGKPILDETGQPVLSAIPGGPAEKVSSETAARLGLAKSFLGQVPAILKEVEAGELTGPINGPVMSHFGKGAQLRRQIASGAEALVRNLTGAGMNLLEAQNYARRYEPAVNDSAATVASKIKQLSRELNYVISVVEKGRKVTNTADLQAVSQQQPQQQAPANQAQQATPNGIPFKFLD